MKISADTICSNDPPEIILGHELVHAWHDIRGEYLKYGVKDEELNTMGSLGLRWPDPASDVYYYKHPARKYTENRIREDYYKKGVQIKGEKVKMRRYYGPWE